MATCDSRQVENREESLLAHQQEDKDRTKGRKRAFLVRKIAMHSFQLIESDYSL